MADTRPPIGQSPKLVTEQQAPDNLPGHTPANGIVNPFQIPVYVRAKVAEGVGAAVEALTAEQQEGQKENTRKRRRATVGSVGFAGVLSVLGGLFFDYRHDQKDEAKEEQKAQLEEQRATLQAQAEQRRELERDKQKSAIQQQLEDHIKKEDEHYQETSQLLHRLLDYELHNKK